MSFYSDASLVLIPSGYKDQKVYSAVPTDGSGDLVFSRASSATRVASNGLIEKVRTNLVLQSQTFDNAAWTKTNVTVTANAAISPDGYTNADKIIPSTDVSKKTINQSNIFTADGQKRTWSIYVKGDGYRYITLGEASITDNTLIFDTTNGVYTQSAINIYFTEILTPVNMGNGWWRIGYTTDLNSAFYDNFTINVTNASTGVPASFAGDGTSGVLLFGAQVELGDIATDYIVTTTAAVSVGPVSGLPRLDYLNSSCPRLLLEPQRTNLATFSEQFDNAAWTTQEITVTANAGIAPDGTQSADKIIPTAVTGTHQILSAALVSSSQCAFGVFAKADGYNTIDMLDRASASNGARFNVLNGTVEQIFGSATATITPYGNGWYRCVVVATTTGVRFYVPTAAGNFTGNGTSGVLFWGAQLEAGAYATSYIPTTTAAVTRLADAASKTGISSLIGQTEGSIFVDFNVITLLAAPSTLEVIPVEVSDGTAGNKIYISVFQGSLYLVLLNSGTAQVVLNLGAIPTGRFKVGATYINNDVRAFLNGSFISSDTSVTIPALTSINVGSFTGLQPQANSINSISLFKTRLTNAQMAELTTL
jgi:hypothetical protein